MKISKEALDEFNSAIKEFVESVSGSLTEDDDFEDDELVSKYDDDENVNNYEEFDEDELADILVVQSDYLEGKLKVIRKEEYLIPHYMKRFSGGTFAFHYIDLRDGSINIKAYCGNAGMNEMRRDLQVRLGKKISSIEWKPSESGYVCVVSYK